MWFCCCRCCCCCVWLRKRCCCCFVCTINRINLAAIHDGCVFFASFLFSWDFVCVFSCAFSKRHEHFENQKIQNDVIKIEINRKFSPKKYIDQFYLAQFFVSRVQQTFWKLFTFSSKFVYTRLVWSNNKKIEFHHIFSDWHKFEEEKNYRKKRKKSRKTKSVWLL